MSDNSFTCADLPANGDKEPDTVHRFLLVSCRQQNDDEDSHFLYENMTLAGATDSAKEEVMDAGEDEGLHFICTAVFASNSEIVCLSSGL